jgi:hypothetical protein
MADPAWLSYTGVVTGIIGTVTGVAGAALGYVGYKQSREMKTLDLRLQLGQAENEVRICLEHLPPLIQRGMRSRTNVSTAMGLGKSGALQEWLGLCSADLEFVRSLTSQLPAADDGYVDLTPAELTAKVVKLHELGLHASRVAKKYDIAFIEDDKAREQVREDVRSLTKG